MRYKICKYTLLKRYAVNSEPYSTGWYEKPEILVYLRIVLVLTVSYFGLKSSNGTQSGKEALRSHEHLQ